MKDIITIDGPSGAGKSTIAKLLAQKLGYSYLDTGALYRAVAWKIREEKVDPENEKELNAMLKKTNIVFEGNSVLVNGADVSSQIRTPAIGELSSKSSARPIVREHLYKLQRQIGLKGKVVIEGRDIGTVIFPEAKNKFFLDASPEERGRRRHEELKKNNPDLSVEVTIESIKKRDERDSTRKNSPLKRTGDMSYIDTSNLTIEEVIKKMSEALKTP
jgi:cytidylate kinase